MEFIHVGKSCASFHAKKIRKLQYTALISRFLRTFTLDNALLDNDYDAVWFYEIVSTSAKSSLSTWISSFLEIHEITMKIPRNEIVYDDEYHTYDDFRIIRPIIDFRHMH